MNIWRHIDQILGPPLCQLCGAEGIGPEICAGCYRDLPRARWVCPLCARPVPVEGICPACSLRRPLYDRARVPFIYDFPVNRLIHRLKYGGARSHGRLLGELTGHALKRNRSLPRVIVPVPLHRKRLSQRGFDQALSIANSVARITGSTLMAGLCVRRRDTPPLWPLSAADRRRLLRGAFLCRDRAPASVAIFDDILTTGATADAMARTLRSAGADQVEVWAVARSPGARLRRRRRRNAAPGPEK
jgi:ComF family protein